MGEHVGGARPAAASSDRPVRLDGGLECRVQDELLVYVPTREIAVSLNASARAVWELCQGRLSVDEITEALGSRYGVSTHLLRPDVDAAIGRLRDLGLLGPHPVDDERPAEPASHPT
jgi:hypothetical protein